MAKYLIKVEALDGSELDKRYTEGIECDGFAVLGDSKESGVAAIHNLSNFDLAGLITNCDHLMIAAELATTMRKIKSSLKKVSEDDFMRHVIESLDNDD